MKRLLPFAAIVAVLALLAGSVDAYECLEEEMIIQPTGDCRLPLMVSNSSTFTIFTNGSTVGTFPNILLVMTRASLEGLTGSVLVNWTGGWSSFSQVNFWEARDGYVPPETVTHFDNGRYTVSELQECLGANSTTEDTIYCVWGAFLGGQSIGQAPQTFTVTLPSTQPKMLVLALAQTVCARFFNMRVVPVETGDVIPEFNPLFLVAAFAALACYAVKTRKTNRSLSLENS